MKKCIVQLLFFLFLITNSYGQIEPLKKENIDELNIKKTKLKLVVRGEFKPSEKTFFLFNCDLCPGKDCGLCFNNADFNQIELADRLIDRSKSESVYKMDTALTQGNYAICVAKITDSNKPDTIYNQLVKVVKIENQKKVKIVLDEETDIRQD